jgi:hypothetical protein
MDDEERRRRLRGVLIKAPAVLSGAASRSVDARVVAEPYIDQILEAFASGDEWKLKDALEDVATTTRAKSTELWDALGID